MPVGFGETITNISMISNPYKNRNRRGETKVDKLITVLSDGKWHSTKELVRRVGPAFGGARYWLAKTGINVQRRAHKKKRWQHEYRIDLDNPFGAPDSGKQNNQQNQAPS